MRALILLLVAACATVPHGPAIPPLPSAGGPAWLEVSSPHFVMWTDSTEQRAKLLLHRMEEHRAIVLHALGQQPADAKIFVIALRDAEEVGAYVPKEFIAYASGTPNPPHQPMIVLAADTDDDHLQIVTHELTHVVSFTFMPHQPSWFAEGLAGYFATAKVWHDGDDLAVEVGHPVDYVLQRLRQYHARPTAALFACKVHVCMDDGYYDSTWALFSFLVNTHVDQLLSYANALQTQPELAWTAIDPQALDHGVAEWLAHGQVRIMKFRLRDEPTPTTSRPLRDADALAARALLRFMFAPTEPGTRTEIEAAIAADHASLLALGVQLTLDKHVSADDAHAAVAAHPDDWRAWWLLGFARAPDSREAFAKMCTLIGSSTVDVPTPMCHQPQ